MVYRHIRLKINASLVLTAMFFVVGMWCFNSGVLTHNWDRAFRDLPLVGSIVGLIVVIAVLVNYFSLRPLVDALKKAESGDPARPEERFAALKAMVRLPIVIITLNVMGFFLGPMGKLIPASLTGGDSFFSTVPLLTLFYNIFIGFVCALTIIIEHNALLAGAKRVLNVTRRDESGGRRVTDMSLRLKNVLFPLGLAVLFGSMMGVAGFSYFSRTLAPDAAATALTEFLLPMGILFLILLVIVLALSVFFSSETSASLNQFSANLSRVLAGEGDLSQRLYLVQFNELGDLAVLYNRLIEMLQGLLQKVKEEAAQTANSSAVLTRFLDKCSAAIGEISTGAGRVNAHSLRQSEAVGTANIVIGEILASIEVVKENVSTQAGFIEQTSAAIHQMSASIATVSTAARKANAVSASLVTLARDGEEKVGQTIQAIEGIEKTSRLVNEIVAVISRIASQTNLLAMNASIEAAHAGAFGKGFAVVADEVKKLAEESAESAWQIGSQIEEMTRSIEQGVVLSRTTGEALGKISTDINQNTELMSSIAMAVEEQNAGAQEILNSVGSIIQTTQDIQTRTADQFARSNRIRDNMDVLVVAATDIRTAAESQGTNLSALKDAVDNLGKVVALNQEVVRELNQAVGKFKL